MRQTFDNLDIAAVVDALNRDQLLVVPTDTVYGIAANPTSTTSIDRLLTAKGRGRDFPSPILVGNIDQVHRIVATVGPQQQTLMEHLWPGALTIIFDAAPTLGWDLGETNGTVAVRMPDHNGLRQLLNRVGPLAVTSANLHHQPPAATIEQAIDYFGETVTVYIDGGPSGEPIPSTIVRIDDDNRVEYLRTGAIKHEVIDNLV